MNPHGFKEKQISDIRNRVKDDNSVSVQGGEHCSFRMPALK